jgi:hypothetical protein
MYGPGHKLVHDDEAFLALFPRGKKLKKGDHALRAKWEKLRAWKIERSRTKNYKKPA